MPKPKSIDAALELLRLDSLMASLQHEVGKSDADPFDDALVAAVVGAADAMKAEGAAMEEARKRIVRLSRG